MAAIGHRTTVGIVDDHALFREGLAAVLTRSMQHTVVFEGETADDAVNNVMTHLPDLVLLDLGLPGNTIDALRKIKERAPGTFCVILTSCDDPLKAMAALSLGAEGYILKGIKGDDLLQALDGILQRRTYVSPEFAMRLVTAANAQSRKASQTSDLSYREEQVIREVQNGLTNREVAAQLKLSEQTVKFYMSSAMQKLGVKNRVGAVREYQRRMSPGGDMPTGLAH